MLILIRNYWIEIQEGGLGAGGAKKWNSTVCASPIAVTGSYNSLNVGVVGTAVIGADDNTDRVFSQTSAADVFTEETGWTPYGTLPIRITVASTAPVITEGSLVSVSMSSNGHPLHFYLVLHATDEDSTSLTWSISDPAGHGLASVEGTEGTSMTILYSPQADYAGSDSFKVEVNDSEGGVATIRVEVTVVAPIRLFLPLVLK